MQDHITQSDLFDNPAKRCNRCNLVVPLSNFRRDARSCHGYVKRCKDCDRKIRHEIDKKHSPKRPKGRQRKSWLKRRFGITESDYNEILAGQGGVCAICKRTPDSLPVRRGRIGFLDVDHCHVTGKIRGILCYLCNQGLGHLKDDPELLRVAISYLEKDRPTSPIVPKDYLRGDSRVR